MTPVMTPTVKVDVVRPGDRAALLHLFEACSEATIVGRFFALLRSFPSAYLDGALANSPKAHDAVVVRYGDGLHVAGLASVVARPGDPRAAELGVLVADGWQGRGLGRSMVETLVSRAARRGAEELAASVLPHRSGLLLALGRRLELTALEPDVDYVTGSYRIPEEVGHGYGEAHSA
jgi:GNAT superfamily N-acetyltransferase